MRFSLFFLLAFPLAVMAEDDFDTKFSTLQKELEQSLKNIRSESRFASYPNDKYIEAYNKLMKEQEAKELDLRKEFCPTGKEGSCGKPDEIKAQYRILVGLENRKNDWAKDGLSEDQMKEKEKLYNECHDKNVNCDKLSEADRKIASEDAPVKKDQPEAKKDSPEGDKDGAKPPRKGSLPREERRDKKEEITQQTKTETSSSTSTTTSSTSESEVKIVVPESEKEDPKPAGKDSAAKTEKSDSKAQGKDAPVKSEKPATSDKKDEGKKEAASKPQEDAAPEVVEEGSDDEKTPRNYKPDTCRWVNDLPRKVVNGPGCGPKQRSKMCTGYVICEQKQGGAKFIRMSTCGADKCGSSDEDAVRCTKDMAYYSMKPQGESKLFMTPALKKVLSNGATRQ